MTGFSVSGLIVEIKYIVYWFYFIKSNRILGCENYSTFHLPFRILIRRPNESIYSIIRSVSYAIYVYISITSDNF